MSRKFNRGALYLACCIASWSCKTTDGYSPSEKLKFERTSSDFGGVFESTLARDFSADNFKYFSWGKLGDPILMDLISDGLARNLSIEDANLNIRLAQVRLEQSERLLKPRFFIGNTDVNVSDSTTSSSSTFFNLDNSISYEIDLWGRNRNAVLLQQLQLVQREIQLQSIRISVAQSIASIYLRIRLTDELISLEEKQVEIQEKQLELARVRVSAGATTNLSVGQIEVSIQRLLSSLETFKLEREQLERTLGILLGYKPSDFQLGKSKASLLIAERLPPDIPPSVIEQRVALRLSECQLIATDVSMDNARNARLPSVLLSSRLGKSAFSLKNLLSTEGFIGSINATLSAFIYDDGNLSRELRGSELNYQKAVLGYRQAVLQAFDEAEATFDREENNIRQSEIQKLEQIAQDKVTQITQVQYDSGSASAFDLIREQRNELLATQNRLFVWNDRVETYIAALGAFSIDPIALVEPEAQQVNPSCYTLTQ